MGEHLERMRSLVYLLLLCAAGVAGLKEGVYGGKHWKLVMDKSQMSGTMEGDCSTGTVGNMVHSEYKVPRAAHLPLGKQLLRCSRVKQAGTGTHVNFTVDLTLQFPASVKRKNITVSNGLLDATNATLTGTFVTGTYEEQFKLVHLASADLFKCINGGSRTQAGWLTMLLAVSVAGFQMFQ